VGNVSHTQKLYIACLQVVVVSCLFYGDLKCWNNKTCKENCCKCAYT